MKYKTGDIIKHKYKLIKKLGEGGTASIFLAQMLNSTNQVVLKISLSENAKVGSQDKRFELEAETLKKMDNPNIVNIFDYFSYEDNLIMVMEYIDGKNLKEVVESKGNLSTKEVAKIMIQILNALQHVHEKNIFHRDLKPQNIMLGKGGVIKLLDFGIVKATPDQQLTMARKVIGTMEYMSPEMIKNDPYIVESEIYSLGIVAYYLLVGKVPFKSSDAHKVASLHLNSIPAPIIEKIPQVDILMNDIVLKMIEKDFHNRYRDAKTLKTVFSNYLTLEDRKNTNENRDKLLLPQVEKQSFFSKLFKKKNK